MTTTILAIAMGIAAVMTAPAAEAARTFGPTEITSPSERVYPARVLESPPWFVDVAVGFGEQADHTPEEAIAIATDRCAAALDLATRECLAVGSDLSQRAVLWMNWTAGDEARYRFQCVA